MRSYWQHEAEEIRIRISRLERDEKSGRHLTPTEVRDLYQLRRRYTEVMRAVEAETAIDTEVCK